MEKAARPYKKPQGGRGYSGRKGQPGFSTRIFHSVKNFPAQKKLTKFELTGVESCKKAPIYPENHAF